MLKILVLLSLWPALCAASVYETVITDQSFSTSSRVVIDENQIKKSKAPNLTNLLASQANISISATTFLPNSIYIRGGDPSHILILVDGVPYFDPTTTQRVANLNSIDLRSVRRIEVLKGSQSVLYGGQALSGVIKIETFPATLVSKTNAQISRGTNDYRQASASQLMSINDSSALIARYAQSSKNNLSPVPNSEFRYPSQNESGEISYIYRDEGELILKSTASTGISMLSGLGATYAAVDTVDFRARTDILGASLIYRNLTSPWLPRLSIGYIRTSSSYIQPINSYSSTGSNDCYRGDALNLRGEFRWINHQDLRVDVGVSDASESLLAISGENVSHHQELLGAFVKAEWTFAGEWSLAAGLRSERVQTRSFFETYHFGVNWADRHKAEISTGFRAASIAQLYGYNANADLNPERALTYSYTEEIPLAPNQQMSVTLFKTEFNDLITTAGNPSKNINLAKTETRGVEAAYAAQWGPRQWMLAVGYQEPWDVGNARWLVRRPLQTASAKVSQQVTANQNATLEAFTNGERLSNITSTRTTSLPAYVVWNGSYNYNFEKLTSAFVRLNNIFDSRYDDSYGFQNEGFSAIIGLEIFN